MFSLKKQEANAPMTSLDAFWDSTSEGRDTEICPGRETATSETSHRKLTSRAPAMTRAGTVEQKRRGNRIQPCDMARWVGYGRDDLEDQQGRTQRAREPGAGSGRRCWSSRGRSRGLLQTVTGSAASRSSRAACMRAVCMWNNSGLGEIPGLHPPAEYPPAL